MQIIAFIGLGEAASALIQGWGPDTAQRITAYDIKLDNPETAAEINTRASSLGIKLAQTSAAAVADAELVFCTVTADQAVIAAQSAAPHLRKGSYWCDLNSCAPSSKRSAQTVIDAQGARYVDVAVMAPVYPKLNMVPLLISGPHATDVAPILQALPMSSRVVAGDVGAASSIKMLRSVIVKGMEALTAECALAAVAAGVEQEVLTSLNKSHPGADWFDQAAYNFERALVHGARRAAEMEEVAKTLDDLGLPNDMACATVRWQRRLAQTGATAQKDTNGQAIAETLLPILRKAPK